MTALLLAAKEFFTSRIGIYTIAAVAVVLAIWLYGHHQYERGRADQIAAEEKAGKKIATGQTKIIHDLQVKYLPAEERIVTVTRTITREVPRYVTIHDDAACTINNGFVRVHDAAAAGTIPSGPAADDGAASGIALSTTASIVAENYGICHQFATRLTEWQEWYSRNKELYESGGGRGR